MNKMHFSKDSPAHAVMNGQGVFVAQANPMTEQHLALANSVQRILAMSGCNTLDELTTKLAAEPKLLTHAASDKGSSDSYLVSKVLPVSASPEVLKLIPHAWIEMLDRDVITPTTIPINHYDSVITLSVDNELVAFIMFRENTPGVDYWISLSYTKPEYRRRGFQAQLFKALCDEGRAKGFHYICSGVLANNEAMLASAASQGRRTRVTVNTEFKL